MIRIQTDLIAAAVLVEKAVSLSWDHSSGNEGSQRDTLKELVGYMTD